ncbi:hypothetical protein ACUZIQ_001856 [Enterobacter hormaechei]
MKKSCFLFVIYFLSAMTVAAEKDPVSSSHQKPFNDLDTGSLVQMRIDDLKQENSRLWELIRSIENQYKAKSDEQAKTAIAKQNELLKNNEYLTQKQSELGSQITRLEDLLKNEKERSTEAEKNKQEEISTLKDELTKYKSKHSHNFNDKKTLQSYVSGLIYSDEIKAMLKGYASLNIDFDIDSLTSGLKDGLNGTTQLESKMIESEKDKLLALVKKREGEVYKKSVSEIKKAIGGKKVAKQNQSAFFVVTHSGKDDYKQGDEVTFDLRIEKLDGESLQHDKSAKIVYQDSMPYVLNQAFNLAKKGGKTEIYGLASDFFAIGEIPESVTNLTPVKIIVDTELK